jgi:hypothetical protein
MRVLISISAALDVPSESRCGRRAERLGHRLRPSHAVESAPLVFLL